MPQRIELIVDRLNGKEIVELIRQGAEVCNVCGRIFMFKSDYRHDKITPRIRNRCDTRECINAQIKDIVWAERGH